MRYVLFAALAAFLVPGSGQVSTGASIRAERGASLSSGRSGLQLFAQGVPGSVYQSGQPNPESNGEGNPA